VAHKPTGAVAQFESVANSWGLVMMTVEDLRAMINEVTVECSSTDSLTESEHTLLSEALVRGALHLEPRSDDLLLGIRRRGEVSMLRFSPIQALTVLANATAGLLNSPLPPVALALMVLGVVASLVTGSRKPTKAEALLFLELRALGGACDIDKLRSRFVKVATQSPGILPEAFASSYQGLLRLGCVEQTGQRCEIRDVIVFFGQQR